MKGLLTKFAKSLGWLVGTLLSAAFLTFLVSVVVDPHGSGPIGEGLIFLAVFTLAVIAGLIFGLIRLSDAMTRQKR